MATTREDGVIRVPLAGCVLEFSEPETPYHGEAFAQATQYDYRDPRAAQPTMEFLTALAWSHAVASGTDGPAAKEAVHKAILAAPDPEWTARHIVDEIVAVMR